MVASATVVLERAGWSYKRPGITVATLASRLPLHLANCIFINNNKLRRRRRQRVQLNLHERFCVASSANSRALRFSPARPLTATERIPVRPEFWVWSICTASFSLAIQHCVQLVLVNRHTNQPPTITFNNNNTNFVIRHWWRPTIRTSNPVMK